MNKDPKTFKLINEKEIRKRERKNKKDREEG